MEACNNFFSKFRPHVHIPLILGGLILMVGLAFLFGFIVMLLWNWLMPEIFGLTKITYWQGWGLVILAHILFKSFPGTHEHKHDKKHSKNGIKEEIKNEMKKAFAKEFKKECEKEESKNTGNLEGEDENESSPTGFEDSSTKEDKD